MPKGHYAFGSHKWEVDTNCCGTDEFGLCTENKLHSEGCFECTFVAPVPLFDISAQAISAFAGMVAEVGGQFQYELDAFANAAVSPNGGSSSTGLTCDVDTNWKSSVTIGGGILVEDGDYSGIDLVVLPGLTVGAGPDGVDWNSDNFFGIHYVRDFMGGKIDLRGGCTLKGDKDAWDVDFGLEFDVAF